MILWNEVESLPAEGQSKEEVTVAICSGDLQCQEAGKPTLPAVISLTCLPTWQTITITKGRKGKDEAVASRWSEVGCSCSYPTLPDRYHADDKKKNFLNFVITPEWHNLHSIFRHIPVKVFPMTWWGEQCRDYYIHLLGFCDIHRVVVQLISNWTRTELQTLQCQIHVVSVPRYLSTIIYSSRLWLQIKATYVQSKEKEI